MSAGDAPPYRLIMNGLMRDWLRTLRARAVMVGTLYRFSETMAQVEAALQTQPSTWGDPLNVLPHMRFTRYHRVIDRLRVVYAVQTDHSVVWLTNVIPLRHSPLRMGEG